MQEIQVPTENFEKQHWLPSGDRLESLYIGKYSKAEVTESRKAFHIYVNVTQTQLGVHGFFFFSSRYCLLLKNHFLEGKNLPEGRKSPDGTCIAGSLLALIFKAPVPEQSFKAPLVL